MSSNKSTALIVLGAVTATALAVAAYNAGSSRGLAMARSGAPSETASVSTPDVPGFTTQQKEGIETIVKNYLLANPELLIEIRDALDAKAEKEQSDKIKSAMAANAKDIYHRADAPEVGNPKGDITVTEFFDYNCGFCKKSFSDIAKLIGDDKNVRVVFKEFPILRKGSVEASKVALAARKQGKYWEVHSALLEYKGSNTDLEVALKIAEKAGVDMARLKTDMEGADIKAELDSVKDLAGKMGINGTPFFLVGDKSISGAPSDLLTQLTTNIGDLRKTGCGYC